MWDTLQVTHEGTTDVKRSRINTLTHEYELFIMNQNETIQDMKKRFTHIVNHLASLGKIFPNEDLINKVLRCLSRQWQPKVTTITESKDLTNMSLANSLWETSRTWNGTYKTLSTWREWQKEERNCTQSLIFFYSWGKWQRRLKWKNLDEDDDFSLFVKRFNKFMRNKGNQRRSNFNPKKKGEDSSLVPKCYECD